MISRISKSNSLDQGHSPFKPVPKKLIACQVQALLEEISASQLTTDTIESKCHLHQPAALQFAISILEYLFESQLILSEEIEAEAVSFFKIYLLKTNFHTFEILLQKLFSLISDKLDKSLDNEPLVSRVFSFLGIFSNWNSGKLQEKSILFNGVDHVFKCTYNKEVDNVRMFLNRDFTLLLCFKMDVERARTPDTAVVLVSFFNEFTHQGYSVILLNNSLWFRHLLPIKGPEMLIEFPVFEKVSDILNSSWNSFFFECQFNEVQKCSNLKFQLNNKVFLVNKSFEDAFFRNQKQTLTVLCGTFFELSLLCVVNQALNADKLQTVQSLLASNGLSTIETFEGFSRVLQSCFDQDGVWVFLHPFCRLTTEEGEFQLADWLNGTSVIVPNENIFSESSASKIRNSLIHSQFFEVVLSLLNFTKDNEDFSNLFKILRNFFSNTEFMKNAFGGKRARLCQSVVGAWLSTKKSACFDQKTIESLFFVLKNQDEKHLTVFWKHLFFDFNFLHKILASEQAVTFFFEEMNKHLNSNLLLLSQFDFNRMTSSAILLLKQGNSLSNVKAFHLLKLTSLGLKIGSCLNDYQIESLLKYFFSPLLNQSVLNMLVLKLVKLYIKQRPLEKRHEKMFINSLTSLFFSTDDCVLLKCIVKLLMTSSQVSQRFLVFMWRKKISDFKANDTTKKLFLNYRRLDKRLRNQDLLVQFVFRKSFLDLSKDHLFANDEMTVDPLGYFDLMLETSLTAEDEIIEQILQSLIVAVANKQFNFSQFSVQTNFLNWLLVLLFDYHPNPDSAHLFDLALKLLVNFSNKYFKTLGSLDHYNAISELVNYFSLEMKNEKVKFIVFKSLLADLNKEEIIFDNQFLASSFVVFFYKFYFSNLANGPFDEIYYESVSAFLTMAHRTINLNPLQTLPLYLTEEVGNVFSEKRSLASSLMNSITFASTSLTEAKSDFCCALTFLTIIATDILECMLTKMKEKPTLEGVFEFLNAYLYRLCYYLENNRKKMRLEKIYLMESSIYFLVQLILKTPAVFSQSKEIIEAIFFFGNKSKVDTDLNSKILKELRVDRKDKSLEFLHALKFEMRPKQLNIEEYNNPTFQERKTDFILLSIGKINEVIELGGLALAEMFSDSHELTVFAGSLDFEKGKRKYHQFLSFESLREFKKICKLFSMYRSLYKFQFSQHGRLFNKHLAKGVSLKFEFDPASMVYNPHFQEIAHYKYLDFITSSYQSPFLKCVFKNSAPEIRFPQDIKLQQDFSFESACAHRNLTFYVCDHISKLHIIPSLLLVNLEKKSLELFINPDDSAVSSITNYGIEIKKFQRKIHQRLSEKILLIEIEDIFPFKFLQQRKAVLILLSNKRQILLNFPKENEYNGFISLINNLLTQSASFAISAIQKQASQLKLVENWLAHRMSNFDFLMQINFYASRSVLDYSQYPVFPLLVKKFDNFITLRDLEKPVGMNSDEKIVANYQAVFESEASNSNKAFFYGSHYSCPAHVFNLLIRKFPETVGSKAIHNNDYDFPDRIFFSIQMMVRNIIEDAADVREWIPEFFYLPEMFLNLNHLDFKINQKGNRIHHVVLPESCRGNPYNFVAMMRQLLESPIVSLKLGNWVDLIFGCKQFGPKAVEAKNLFYPLTYEQNFKELKLDTDEKANSTFNQIYNFGQVPVLLFPKPVANKKITGDQQTLASVDSKTKYFLRYRDLDHGNANPVIFVKKMKEKGRKEAKSIKRLIIVKQTSVEIWKFKITSNVKNDLNPYEMILEQTFVTAKMGKIFKLAGGCNSLEDVVEIASESRILMGGLLNGAIIFFNFKTEKQLNKQLLHEITIVKLKFTKKDELLTADSKGVLKLSSFDSKNNQLQPLRTFLDYFNSDIFNFNFCREDTRLLCFDTQECIEVRSLGNFSERLFSIRKSKLKFLPSKASSEPLVTNAFLSLGYVNCVVLFAFFESKNHLFAFSLLGQLIGYYVLDDPKEAMFTHFEFVSDETFRKHLLIANAKGDVFLFDLPFFEFGRKINSNQNNKIKHVSMFLRNQLAMVVDEKGYIDILSTAAPRFENGN